MPKAPTKKSVKAKPPGVDSSNLELDPDAWPKFEKLIESAAKMGPKPHKAKD
jgi:hypothetical protein